MARYASATTVPVDRSRAAIEQLLQKHGATAFAYGWNEGHDTMQFTLHNRTIRFVLPRVKQDEFTKTDTGRRRAPQAVSLLMAQANRQRWRALALVIRAKLEAVEAGIAMFESEFLAFIVTPNGQTVGDILVPRLLRNESLRLPAAREDA